MILIIGGHASGKYEYLKTTLGYDSEDIAIAVLDDKPALANLHELIKNRAEGNSPNTTSDEFLEELLQKEVITCNELGCGIVPLNKIDRDYREEVGRTCIELAKHAKKVIRIYSGIPTVIKDCV